MADETTPARPPEPASPEASEKRSKSKTGSIEAAPEGVLVAFTIDTTTGRIAKVEAVDAGGARRDLNEDEKNRLLAKAAEVTLESVVERAFEAGLECALADDDDDPGIAAPTQAELNLRHLVLRSLMADTVADRLIKREVLNRAIAGTLIRQGVGGQHVYAH